MDFTESELHDISSMFGTGKAKLQKGYFYFFETRHHLTNYKHNISRILRSLASVRLEHQPQTKVWIFKYGFVVGKIIYKQGLKREPKLAYEITRSKRAPFNPIIYGCYSASHWSSDHFQNCMPITIIHSFGIFVRKCQKSIMINWNMQQTNSTYTKEGQDQVQVEFWIDFWHDIEQTRWANMDIRILRTITVNSNAVYFWKKLKFWISWFILQFMMKRRKTLNWAECRQMFDTSFEIYSCRTNLK